MISQEKKEPRSTGLRELSRKAGELLKKVKLNSIYKRNPVDKKIC
jgi:hypothetical protein